MNKQKEQKKVVQPVSKFYVPVNLSEQANFCRIALKASMEAEKRANEHYVSIDDDLDYGKFKNEFVGININGHEIDSWKPIGHILHYIIVQNISDEHKISIQTLKKMIRWSLNIEEDGLYHELMMAIWYHKSVSCISTEFTSPKAPKELTDFLHELPNLNDVDGGDDAQ